MPRSKTATECDVFAVISFAIKRPVQPPPMMATSTGLRLVMREPRFPSPLSFLGAVQPILPIPADVVEVGGTNSKPNRARLHHRRAAAEGRGLDSQLQQ